jgi:hypothetical protein
VTRNLGGKLCTLDGLAQIDLDVRVEIGAARRTALATEQIAEVELDRSVLEPRALLARVLPLRILARLSLIEAST